ncbi:NADH:ubiquinone oxidoreductase intermediate-associated protein 30 [Trinorchestia longiramus]|nr:NADH:ubiquinone oxidoreductase intermediate-associated protein 30 [Trinorchestia longiramus]
MWFVSSMERISGMPGVLKRTGFTHNPSGWFTWGCSVSTKRKSNLLDSTYKYGLTIRGLQSNPPIGFNELERRSGYRKNDKVDTVKQIRTGLKQLRMEVAKWQKEVKDTIAQDHLWVFPGDRDTVWLFSTQNKSPLSGGYCSHPTGEGSIINPVTSTNTQHDVLESRSEFDGWVVTTDSDNNEGLSTARLTTSPAGHGLFTGFLNTKVPKDGKLFHTGYCNMNSVPPSKSFGRPLHLNWGNYTHLVIRCRGDGRSYMLNLGAPGRFDVSWNDMFHYPLYTRGGPHWQTYRIPFSKFYFSSKGTVQDKQSTIMPSHVSTMGISVGDKINGVFRLEIDYIAVENDPIHTEESAYELYEAPHLYLGI